MRRRRRKTRLVINAVVRVHKVLVKLNADLNDTHARRYQALVAALRSFIITRRGIMLLRPQSSTSVGIVWTGMQATRIVGGTTASSHKAGGRRCEFITRIARRTDGVGVAPANIINQDRARVRICRPLTATAKTMSKRQR